MLPKLHKVGWRGVAWRLAAAALITGLSLWLLLPALDWRALGAALVGADWHWLGAAALCVILGQAARGLRVWSVVSHPALPVSRAWCASIWHSFFASLLPFRLGEGVLIYLLRRATGQGLGESAGVLVILRILDLGVIVSLAGVLGALLVDQRLGGLGRGAMLGLGLAALSCLVLFPWIAHLALLAATQWVGRKWPGAAVARLVGTLLAPAERATPRQLTLWTLWTLAVWVGLMASYHCAALALRPEQSVPLSLFASAVGNIAFVLPINGLAQVGPYQAAWAQAALAASDTLTPTLALAMALLIHAVGLLTGAMQALLAWLLSPAWPRPSLPPDGP